MDKKLEKLIDISIEKIAAFLDPWGEKPSSQDVDVALKVVLQYMRVVEKRAEKEADKERREADLERINRIEKLLDKLK